jgi:hypothetical protein
MALACLEWVEWSEPAVPRVLRERPKVGGVTLFQGGDKRVCMYEREVLGVT